MPSSENRADRTFGGGIPVRFVVDFTSKRRCVKYANENSAHARPEQFNDTRNCPAAAPEKIEKPLVARGHVVRLNSVNTGRITGKADCTEVADTETADRLFIVHVSRISDEGAKSNSVCRALFDSSPAMPTASSTDTRMVLQQPVVAEIELFLATAKGIALPVNETVAQKMLYRVTGTSPVMDKTTACTVAEIDTPLSTMSPVV